MAATSTRGLATRRLLVTLGAVLAVGWGSGCGWPFRRAPLRVVVESVPGTLDPHRQNQIVSWAIVANVCEGLVGFTGDMRLEPVLAEGWERLDTERVRFRLRKGVVFHDGSKLGAGDVVASFERARASPVPGIQHHLIGIRAVRAEGEDTVLFETDGPAPTLLNRLAYLFIVPRTQATEREIAQPIGTGPYRVAGRDADGTVRLEAFAGWRGRPQVGRAEFRGEPDGSRAVAALLRGEVDVLRRLPDERLPEVTRARGVRAQVQPGMQVRLLVTVPGAAKGAARRALADPRVRRAMLHAIDRQRLVDEGFRGNGTVASQFVHPVVFGFDPSIAPLPYDPRRARELLAEAGFGAGFAVELGHGELPWQAVAPIVEDLERVGLQVKVRPLPFPELLAQARDIPLLYYGRSCTIGDAQDFLDALLHTPDPARGYGTENWGGYSNPRADQAIEAAGRELDPARRLVLLQQAQRVVLEDLPVLPLVIRWNYLGLSDRIEVPSRYDEWLVLADFRWRS